MKLSKVYSFTDDNTISATFFFVQVLPILTKKLQSQSIVFSGVAGNQPAKTCPKVN